MTIVIENVKEEFLPAFKGLAKGAQAKLTTKKEKPKPKLVNALDKAIKEYKQGKTHLYKDINEYKAKIDE
ncbi:hypothetical protein [Helicobacter fennelliae]|uniref:Uncharacterized protein n=1 Tax=Helicobacter fennelliae MRY12-0050 TaxID=1325130 RepID=T1DX58_9HELI|nr:hypothetical protein [Helicobacter fennelliae]GAD19967.1 hypothetical protein HFN_1211 [Helicobacter fennelliae MRY12-0050]STP07550.1 Uncharacterised protein [Helicobacter fennelliae]STQ85035.1 Uncharacterised protein [Helicobacter fennelliae]